MTSSLSVSAAPGELSPLTYAERMKRFGEAIDAFRNRSEADFGARDVTRIHIEGVSKGSVLANNQ